MNIWINSPFDPLPLEGGRPLRYELLARALVELGHEVVWWSSDFHHLRKERRSLETVYKHDGFEVRLIPTFPYQRNVSWRRWRSHLQYAKRWGVMAGEALASGELKSPDAVIISMPPLGLYPVARKICDAAGVKLFVDVQDAWPETFYQMRPQLPLFFKRVLLAPMQSMAAKEYCGADFLTAVSKAYIELAKESGCHAEAKVFPLGCGRDESEIEYDRDFDGDELKLVYVGNLGVSYDLKTMINGVQELTKSGINVSLKIAGDGPLCEYVKSAVKSAGGSISYLGYLTSDKMISLLYESHVGVVPMKPESLVAIPNKLIDYASRGLAVISSLTGESQSLLDEYQVGVGYVFGDRQSFMKTVKRYYSDRKMLASHISNSQKLFTDKFDASKIYPAMAQWIVERSSAPEGA